MTLLIGIIAAAPENQASTVNDSIDCYFRYGNYNYKLIKVYQGEILDKLDELDAIIVHYSVVAYPMRYHLPLSANSAFKIRGYTKPKIAFVQDEQRACRERFDFLNALGINHLFSVAPNNLHDVLYPENERNFEVSTVLTGYLTDQHLELSKKSIPLVERSIDIGYRGRKLPPWLGLTGTLKGQIPHLLEQIDALKECSLDVSEKESARFYGDSWFAFLLNVRISIGTPSGSDYLDLDGKYQEKWLPKFPNKTSALREPIPAEYQVVSPRIFDYVAAGNLIALTPGSYSNIPIQGTYVPISNTLSELMDVVRFAKTKEAQSIVDFAQKQILFNPNLHFRHLVCLVEEKIQSFVTEENYLASSSLKRKTSSQSHFSHKLVNWVKNRYVLKKIYRNLPSKVAEKVQLIYIIMRTKSYHQRRNFLLFCRFQNLKMAWSWRLNPRLIYELFIINNVSKHSELLDITIAKDSMKVIFKGNPNPQDISLPLPQINHPQVKLMWQVELILFGNNFYDANLRVIPQVFSYDTAQLYSYFNYVNNLK